MAFYEFPGSNFHDLNLDWLLQEMKNCLAEWTEVRQNWTETDQDWQELKEYVQNYFANLDVSQEISDKINQMALDGTLLQIIKSTIQATTATASSAWLAEHVNPATGYVIDDSLSIQNAAADAKAVGDALAHVNCEEITLETFGSITTAVAIGETVDLTPTTIQTGKYAIIDCNPGDQFTICGSGGISSPVYAFIDANNVLLGVGGPQAAYNYYVVTAPSNTAKVILQNNSTVMPIQSQYKGVYIPETLDGVASAATPRVPPMRWINGGVNTSGFVTSTTNKRSVGITFKPGERLIISNTNKDVNFAVYGAKNNVFKVVGDGYVYGGARVELRDWEFSYYIRLSPHTGSARPDPDSGGYISVSIVPDTVPYENGYVRWAAYPQIGIRRTYCDIKSVLAFEPKTITTSGIADSTNSCLVTLPNTGWVEVKQEQQVIQFKIAEVAPNGTITFPVSEWCYYQYRYKGDGETTYYALVTLSPGATVGDDQIMHLARKYLGVYTYTDEGAAYDHGYYLAKRHIAFMGDSIAQGRCDEDGVEGLDTTLAKPFPEMVAEIAGDGNVGNFSIGGAYLSGTSWKSLKTNCGKVRGYDIVFVVGGTNDYGGNVTEANFTADLTTIVETLMAANTEVILCTPTARRNPDANTAGLWLGDYARIIKEVAAAKGLKCIDLNALTSDGCFQIFCPDNLHPNEKGHWIVADWIAKECDRLGLL